jgi:hypothetical protein
MLLYLEKRLLGASLSKKEIEWYYKWWEYDVEILWEKYKLKLEKPILTEEEYKELLAKYEEYESYVITKEKLIWLRKKIEEENNNLDKDDYRLKWLRWWY